MKLWIDLETYSATDLKKTNVYRYSEDIEFLILMAAWSTDGKTVHLALGEDEIRAIPGLGTALHVAHNAQFERVCLSRLIGMETGKYLDPALFHDTMAVAAEKGYPQSLGALGRALGGEQKDEAGTALIKFFCTPNKYGKRNMPEDYPEKWAQFCEYCRQDVVTLIDVDERLGDWPTEMEHQVWLSDQRINDKGMKVDTELATVAMDAAEDNRMLAEIEVSQLTGVDNPGSVQQMRAWFESVGIVAPDLQAATVQSLLADPELDPLARRVLHLRVELALVAAKKFASALASVSEDGRLRGGFRFFGAHTGRWTGQGVQPHNLPRAQLDSDVGTDAAILDLKLGVGAEPYVLKALVRAMFTGPFTVVDYSSIEARVIAWLAGEAWALKAFRAGRDIYVETAERMGGLTRAQGKVAVLALGYAGGVGSLKAMGAGSTLPVHKTHGMDEKAHAGAFSIGEAREGPLGMNTDEQLQTMVDQWRAANPSIVDLWKQMEERFRYGGAVGDWVSVEVEDDTRKIRLPSGRAITYHGCKWQMVETEYGLKRQARFLDPKTGTRVGTYGGRLIENVTQAVARDILAEALVRLHKENYAIVAHVHDEILVEGVGTHSVQVVSRIMNESPKWAAGLPIGSEGFTCARYRKG